MFTSLSFLFFGLVFAADCFRLFLCPIGHTLRLYFTKYIHTLIAGSLTVIKVLAEHSAATGICRNSEAACHKEKLAVSSLIFGFENVRIDSDNLAVNVILIVVGDKIRKLTTDANGEPGFVTYGTTTDTDDETVVTYPYVLGKYSSHIPKVGTFFQFLKSTPGYIVCILIPFLLLILLEGIRCIRLFRKYKAEQQAELQAERDKIEADRAETQRMMQELLQMKAQMAQNGGETPKTDETPSDTTTV